MSDMDDWLPSIATGSFPAEEAVAIKHLTFALSNLGSYLEDFQAALALFEFSRGQYEMLAKTRHDAVLEARLKNTFPPPREVVTSPLNDWRMLAQWQFVAGRDGAMSIYHFGKTLEAIRETGFIGCPVFKDKIDHSKLRIGFKLFRQWFPAFERIRHSVAHSADLVKTPASRKRNAWGQLTMRNVLTIDRNFQNTYGGQVLSYEVTPKTLSRLKKVRDQFYEPFKPFDLISMLRSQEPLKSWTR